MALGSFAHSSLADLDPDDLKRMLALDESLFVEHKSGAGKADSSHQLVSAIAAFANTLGGWVLLGVHAGKVVGGQPAWATGTQGFIDFVRDRVRHQLDPMPAFEARVIELPDGPVGVIRVYESSDTPHISTNNGAVYVREVAGVRNTARPKQSGSGRRADTLYEVAKILSRAQLLELADRGQRATARLNRLLGEPSGEGYGMLGELAELHAAAGYDVADQAVVVVRAAPYTLPSPFVDWATSHDGAAATLQVAERLAHISGLASSWIEPTVRGAQVTIGMQKPPILARLQRPLPSQCAVALDSAGVVGVAIAIAGPDDPEDRGYLGVVDLAEAVFQPLLESVAALLTASPALGRVRCSVVAVRLHAVTFLDGQSSRFRPVDLGLDRDLTLPGPDLPSIARAASYAYARSVGIRAFT